MQTFIDNSDIEYHHRPIPPEPNQLNQLSGFKRPRSFANAMTAMNNHYTDCNEWSPMFDPMQTTMLSLDGLHPSSLKSDLWSPIFNPTQSAMLTLQSSIPDIPQN